MNYIPFCVSNHISESDNTFSALLTFTSLFFALFLNFQNLYSWLFFSLDLLTNWIEEWIIVKSIQLSSWSETLFVIGRFFSSPHQRNSSYYAVIYQPKFYGKIANYGRILASSVGDFLNYISFCVSNHVSESDNTFNAFFTFVSLFFALFLNFQNLYSKHFSH